MLREGGYGVVYGGHLVNGIEVAIKKIMYLTTIFIKPPFGFELLL